MKMATDKIQRTLAMIKPDAIDRASEIEKVIQQEGFTIVERRRVRLTRPEAEEFYGEHRGKSFYSSLVDYMTSGEVLALILAGEEAIIQWRNVLGPTRVSQARQEAPESLRARFGDPTNDSHNAAHGSDSVTSAQREIKFFFPDCTLLAPCGQKIKAELSHL